MHLKGHLFWQAAANATSSGSFQRQQERIHRAHVVLVPVDHSQDHATGCSLVVHRAFDGPVGARGFLVGCAHVSGMALVVEADTRLHPMGVV